MNGRRPFLKCGSDRRGHEGSSSLRAWALRFVSAGATGNCIRQMCNMTDADLPRRWSSLSERAGPYQRVARGERADSRETGILHKLQTLVTNYNFRTAIVAISD
jgi:hypothetical protein